jgi:putative sterol carrier protein
MQSKDLFKEIENSLKNSELKEKAKKANSIFQFNISTKDSIENWTLDLKQGTCYPGLPKDKAQITITVKDQDFCDLALGKLNGQKAFMSGKLKVKGNMMLATKLDGLLKDLITKAKL